MSTTIAARIEEHRVTIELKYFSLSLAALLALPCAYALAEPKEEQMRLIEACEHAKQGTLKVNSLDHNNSLNNAYLFACAVSIHIGDPNPISGESGTDAQRNAEKQKRTKIADLLLSQKIDLNFKNEYGDTT